VFGVNHDRFVRWPKWPVFITYYNKFLGKKNVLISKYIFIKLLQFLLHARKNWTNWTVFFKPPSQNEFRSIKMPLRVLTQTPTDMAVRQGNLNNSVALVVGTPPPLHCLGIHGSGVCFLCEVARWFA
jgi:hypothetical protein